MNKPFRILSLSGGGIRGVFQAIFLSKIAKKLSEPFWSNFDLICGTSTGSIIGMAVAMGSDLDEISNLYIKKGNIIFKKRFFGGLARGPVYDQKILHNELYKIFKDQTLNDAYTKVLVTSASINKFDHKVFCNFSTISDSDRNLPIVDVILSSTAAPTYFSPFTPKGQHRSFVDGGVWANSPSMLGILFANKYLKVPLSNIKLLSVGTGDFANGEPLEYFRKLRQVSLKSIQTIFELMFSSQSSFDDHFAGQILGEENYLRVSENLKEKILLDDFEKALKILPSLAERASEIHETRIKKLLDIHVNGHEFVQKVDRQNLISEFLINETGLSAFYPSREYYSVREDAKSIDRYVSEAKNSLIMVSISLIKGIYFDNLKEVLLRKLKSETERFEVTISLLNPHREYLVESIGQVFGKNKKEIIEDIEGGLTILKQLRSDLPIGIQNRFHIRTHNSLPFGSAIILDHDKLYGKIQIETKPYQAPYGKSFGFEVIPIKKDGFYSTLVESYINLIKHGQDH